MKSEQYIQYGVVIICFAIYFIINLRSCKESEEVQMYHNFVLGKIDKVYHIGGSASRYIDYSYTVNDITYSRSIACHDYRECEVNIELCKNKRFWVAYSTKDFAHSLINIGLEVQDIQNPSPPASLDYFK
jgi:hypothetical protein